MAEAHHVPGWVTAVFGCILVGLILCLALEEKLHAKKSVIAGVFAVISLFFGSFWGILSFDEVVVGSDELVIHNEVEGIATDYDGTTKQIAVPPVLGDGESGMPTESHEGVESVHVGGHRVHMPAYIPGVDWGVIAIILGSSLFVDVTSKSGLFTWIAIVVTKLSRGDPLRLFVFYGLMTVVFSAVLNNVTAMIIVGSLTAVSLKKLDRTGSLLGFLFIEGLLTNIGGLLTLISSVPNIIVGTAANISFFEFFIRAAPYVVVATVMTLWMGAKLFRIRSLRTEDERAEAETKVASFDENDGIESWGFFWFGTAMLMLFILTIATTSVLPVVSDLEMGFVAIAFAVIMLLRFKHSADEFYQALDWDLIGFFIALFVIINVMEHASVLDAIGVVLAKIINWGDTLGTGSVLLASAAFSSVTDNIPLAAMLSRILTSLGTPINGADSVADPLWWAVIFGANLGGNLTPIGSASTLVAVTIIHRNKIKLSFAAFVKLAFPYAAAHISLAVIYVLLFF